MCLELVIGYLVSGHPDFGKHSGASLDHHGRAAEIIFDRQGMDVFAEVVLQHDLVDKADMASPVVLRQRRGERQVEGKVVVRPGEVFKVVFIEDLLSGTRTVPEADFASRLFGLKKVGEMGS